MKVAGEEAAFEALVRRFERLGLTPYETQILLALLRLGSAGSSELARVSGVPRTSIYKTLETLSSKGLVERIAREGPALWASPGREEMMDRIEAHETHKLAEARTEIEQLRQVLADVFGDSPSLVPQVGFLAKPSDHRRAFEEGLTAAVSEVLLFSRSPFTVKPGKPRPIALETLARGITVRAIYEAGEFAHPASSGFRRQIQSYVEAGVQVRVVESLPLKMAVFDRQTALVALTDSISPASDYPSGLLVRDPGFARAHAKVFEVEWAEGQVYDPRIHGVHPLEEQTA